MPSAPALGIRRLTVRYGDAVDDLDLTIPRGRSAPGRAAGAGARRRPAAAAPGRADLRHGRRGAPRLLVVGLSLDEKAAGGAIGILGVVLAALGGLWWPVEMLPAAMRGLACTLPSYWYAELGRGVVAGGWPAAGAVLAMAGFTAAFGLIAVPVARKRPLHAVGG